MNRLIIFLSITAIVLIGTSCFDSYDTDECDYTNCNTIYPSQGTMTVRVSETDDGVPIEIYEGFFDTGILFARDTIRSYEKDYFLAPEMYYTVVAQYKGNDGTINVIDGGRIHVKSTKMCDSNCYSVQDLTINAKLKY